MNRGWKADHIRNAENIMRMLKNSRKLFDMSQQEVAFQLGKTQGWLSQIEHGNNISLVDACELAELYGLELKLCDKKQS